MSPRTRLIIIIAIVILILGGVVWLVSNAAKKPGGLFATGTVTPTAVTPTTTSRFIDSSNFTTSSLSAIANPATSPTVSTTENSTPVEIEKKGVESFARVFTQIYGSFSSDNNYQNVYDVQALATPQLWSKIKPPTTPKPAAASFTGVTTQVLLTSLLVWNGTSATVEVEALRTQTSAGKTSTFNQKAVVTLVKQGDSWLVDSFTWAKI